jgi:hypothetical protein
MSYRYAVEGFTVTADPINKYVNFDRHISASNEPILVTFGRTYVTTSPTRDRDTEHAECFDTVVHRDPRILWMDPC